MYNLPPRWLHNGVALWSLNVKSYRLHSSSRLWSHQRHSRKSGNLTIKAQETKWFSGCPHLRGWQAFSPATFHGLGSSLKLLIQSFTDIGGSQWYPFFLRKIEEIKHLPIESLNDLTAPGRSLYPRSKNPVSSSLINSVRYFPAIFWGRKESVEKIAFSECFWRDFLNPINLSQFSRRFLLRVILCWITYSYRKSAFFLTFFEFTQ